MNWFKNLFKSQDKISITVEGVNPQTENEFKFFRFVENEPVYFLERWFEESKKLGHKFKPQYLEAILKKIQTGSFKNPHKFPEYFNSDFDFIAIDFETANNNRVSACALGLAFVKNETFVHKEKHFILPPKGEKVLSTHTNLHGITNDDLEFSLNFRELWDYELHKYFNNNLIVFHNASMDLSVMKSLFSFYEIKNFNINYLDTMRLAEKTGHPKKLTDLAKKFDIEITNHHDPQEDAAVCANVFSELIELFPDYRELIKNINSDNSEAKKSSKDLSLIVENENLDIIRRYSITKEDLNSICIKESGFVFTGELTENRESCKEFIIKYGGLIKPSVTCNVDFVIIGAGYGWSKIQKINVLNSQKNKNIKILSNGDFMELKERYENTNH